MPRFDEPDVSSDEIQDAIFSALNDPLGGNKILPTEVGLTAGTGRGVSPSAQLAHIPPGTDLPQCESRRSYWEIGTFQCDYPAHAVGTLHRNWNSTPGVQHVWTDEESNAAPYSLDDLYPPDVDQGVLR